MFSLFDFFQQVVLEFPTSMQVTNVLSFDRETLFVLVFFVIVFIGRSLKLPVVVLQKK